MSMSDPIADLLTRVRNAQLAGKASVKIPGSTRKQAVCQVLVDEGYVASFSVEALENNKSEITVTLKYFEGSPVISKIKRVSRPGLRIYRGAGDIPSVLNGLGVAIVSTSKGVVSDRKAREMGEGGEVIAYVS